MHVLASTWMFKPKNHSMEAGPFYAGDQVTELKMTARWGSWSKQRQGHVLGSPIKFIS